MKRYYKFILPVLLILVLIFGSCTAAYAALPDTLMNELFEAFQGVNQGTQQASKNFIKKSFDSVGFMIDETGILIQKVKDAIHGVDNDFDNTNATDQDVADWITSNVTSANGIVSFGDQYNTFIKEYKNIYEEDNNINIWNCVSAPRTPSNILNNGFMSDAIPLMNSYGNSAYFILSGANNNSTYFYIVPKSNGMIYGVQSSAPSTKWHGFQLYRCKDLGGSLIYDPIYNRDEDNIVYSVGNDGHLTLINDNSTIDQGYNASIIGAYFVNESYQPAEDANWKTYPKCFTMGVDTIQTFTSASVLDNYIHTVGIGLQPYYVNHSVWQDFSTTSGDYNVSENNINTVTYSDVVSYVNDYHDTNNNYPDNSTVNNWIETTNNNNSGSGGGGSGGNGSGSGGDSTGIFDFLSKIGQVLGNLIKNLGSVLTDLIEGIAETISGLFESIPTIFGDFLGALLGWLPDELRTLIILGISAMIIVGLIKVFRG